MTSPTTPTTARPRRLSLALSLFLALACVSSLIAQTGRISGNVTSQSTGNALQGAVVTLSSGRTALTDGSGRFLFTEVPAGTVSVTASYSGFKDQKVEAALSAGGSQELAIILPSSDVLTLAPFTVESVKGRRAVRGPCSRRRRRDGG